MRPLLDVPKSRLIATLDKAKIPFADDPTNRDTTFTRPRWRRLMPELAKEGVDARNIAQADGEACARECCARSGRRSR